MRKALCTVLLFLFFLDTWSQTITPKGPTGFCPGDFVTLTITGAPAGSSYKWFRNSVQVPGSFATYNANIAGTYTAIVTRPGKPDTTLNDVVVNAYTQPAASFTFSKDSVCSGIPINFTATVSNGTPPYTYSWDFNDGTPAVTGQNPTHTYMSLGCGVFTFNPKLTITDANGCSSTVATRPVHVKQAPDVQLNDVNGFTPFKNCDKNPTAANPNDTLTVANISPSAGCVTSYTLDWGDGSAIVTNPTFPLTHIYKQLGEFNLVFTGMGTNGCANSKTYVVANQSNPDIGIGTVGSTIGCAPLSVSAVVSLWTGNSPGTKYLLEFGDGSSLNLSHPINPAYTNDTINHTYTVSPCPVPTFQLRITAINGCKSKSFVGGDIEVRTKPQPDFNIPKPVYCVNTSVCFTDATIAGSYADCSKKAIYSWDFGDGTKSSDQGNTCHVYKTPGIYTVTLSTSNPCGEGTVTKKVCITGPPTSSFTLDTAEGCAPLTIAAKNNSVAGETCATATYFWRVSYSATNCGTGGTENYFVRGTTATSQNPVFSFSNPGTYTVTLEVTNSCGTVSSSKTVVVKSPPKATLPDYPNACSSTTFNPSQNAVVTNCGSGPLTYSWTFAGGTPATSTAADPGLVVFNTLGTHSITLTISNECGTTTVTKSFGIDPAPDLSIPKNDTACADETIGPYNFRSTTAGATFSWTNSNPAIGLAGGGTGGTIAGFKAVNNTAAPLTATITVSAAKGGCSSQQSFTITVNPTPAKPAVIQPVFYCLNESALPLTATALAGNQLSWYSSFPGTGSATPLIPSTATDGTKTYYVTQTNGFFCQSEAASIAVTVFPKIGSNVVGKDQTICNGSSTQALTSQSSLTGGSGVYNYQWQVSTDGGSTWTNIQGATSSAHNPGAVTATATYRRLVTSSSCADTSNAVTITVQGSLTNIGISAGQTVCDGGQPDTLRGQTPAGGNGTFAYQWEQSPDGVTWTAVPSASSADFLPPTLTATTHYRRKVSSGQCTVYSQAVIITVNPRPAMVPVADKVVCNNSPSGSISLASVPAATSYAWLNDNPAIGLAAAGTGNVPSFTTANGTSPKVPAVATIRAAATFSAGGKSCTGDTALFKIIVLPSVSISPISDTALCTGQTVPAYTPQVADTGFYQGVEIRYKWTVSGNGITLATGSGTQIPAFSTLNTGTVDLFATVTVTPTYTYVGQTCDGLPESFSVTVKPSTAGANAGQDQTLCAQSTVNLSASFVSGTTGVWSQVGTNATITSPTQTITTVTGLLPGTVYRFVWTQTGFASCPSTADTVVINNLPLLVNKIDTTTKTICAGGEINIAGFPAQGGSGVYSYQWQQSTDGVNFTNISNATSQNIFITPEGTVWLRRNVMAAPCEGYSDTVKINVQPALTNNVIGSDNAICIGSAASVIKGSLPSGGNNVFSYRWEQSTNGGATWTVIPAATDVDYSPGVLPQTTQFRRIVSTDLCTGPFGSTSNVVTVTVNPDAKASFLPTDTVKCAPFRITPSVINLQPSLANSQYLWYANDSLIGSGTTFPGYSIQNENESVTIKLKVISAFGCKNDSLSQLFRTVKQPSPSFTLSDTVGCGPLTVSFANKSTYINEFTYFWDFGNGQTSTAVQPRAVVFLPNPAYGDTTYLVKLKVFSACDTSVFTRSIRVKSAPKALFTPVKTVGCSPMQAVFRNNSRGINNTYFWDFGDGATLSTTSPDSVRHLYNTGKVDTFYVKLKVVNECGSDSIRYAVVVSPNTINLNLIVNGPEHFGCTPHAVAFINNSSGASTFQWVFGDGNILSTRKNIDTVYHEFKSAGTYRIQLRAFNNCSDTTTTEIITVYPKPKAAFTANNNTVCIGDSVRFRNLSDSATSYLWQFGDGNMSTLVQPTHKYAAAGLYTVRLIIFRNNPSGSVCTDSTLQQVQVDSTLTGAFTASDTTAQCAPLTVTFVNRTKPSVLAAWDFGDGSTITGDSVVHTFTQFGTYLVRLTVKVPGGCRFVATKTVTVSGPGGTLRYTGGYACSGNAVQLQAVAGNTDTYEWDFGDGTKQTTTQGTVFHSYANPGTYLPSVKLKNAAGCIFPVKGVDSIKVDKVTGGFRTSQQLLCGSTSVQFSDTSRAFFGKALIKWSFGDGTFGTGVSPNHEYTASGTYPMEMIVISNSGCSDTVRKQLNIQVNSKPTVSINAIDKGCTGRPITFNSTLQSADAINIRKWTLSNGATGSGSSFTYQFLNPGTYTLQFVAGTVNGCYDTTSTTILINPGPTLTVSASTNMCLGGSVPLSASGAETYQWLPLSGLSCYTCTNPVASPTVTTQYGVEGKNSFGCAVRDTVVVTVIQPLNLTTSGNDSICIGQSANLLVSGGTAYSWSPAIGLSNTNTSNPVATPQLTTTYRVVGYDGYNCFTDTAFVTVAVGQYPTVDLGPDLLLAAGTQHTLASVVTNGPIRNWAWTPTANLSCGNCALPVAEIKKDISYSVRVTTPYGCSASDTINIKVFCESSQVFVPNAFTPDGDGINDILMVRSKGVVTVKYFRIFNRWGNLVFEKDNFPPNNPLYGWDGKISGVVGGPDVYVYTCEVMCENGSTFTYKGNVSIIK